MSPTRFILFLLIISLLTGCTDVGPVDDKIVPPVTTGVLEIEIRLPNMPLPKSGIHLVDLSLARTADSLSRKLFVASANVYDDKTLYRFVLKPGFYYYQAGITCSCLGDSCLWGGFPGGRYGVRWAVERVEIKKGQVLRDSPSFQ
jgi:hypothetical protein